MLIIEIVLQKYVRMPSLKHILQALLTQREEHANIKYRISSFRLNNPVLKKGEFNGKSYEISRCNG